MEVRSLVFLVPIYDSFEAAAAHPLIQWELEDSV